MKGTGISEIKLVTIGVQDLDRSIKFYRDALGYVASEKATIKGKDFEKAWLMPAGMQGKCAMVSAPGMNSGMLRLVQFNKPGERIWGSYTSKEVLGHYAPNFGVRDLHAVWPRLLAAGGKPKAQPKLWKVSDKLSAWDSQVYDLDGVVVDVFQLIEEGGKPQEIEVSEIQTMAIHVTSALRAKAFYQGLGFKKALYETVIENLEDFFELPKGTKLHNINLMNAEFSTNGRIEIVEYVGLKMKSMRERAVPPNYGILSISFETDNLDSACQLAKSLGAQPIAEPVRVTLPKLGQVRLATFFGLDGEVLEFYQV